MSRSLLSFPKLAAVGLILSATALGGCGRKGPLDLPPSAAGKPGVQSSVQDTSDPTYRSSSQSSPTETTLFGTGGSSIGSGQVVAPRGVNKRIPLDAILD